MRCSGASSPTRGGPARPPIPGCGSLPWAPDYIGFGHSSQPPADKFDYTFENLATYVDGFVTQLALKRFVLVVQDHSGPIGMRLAAWPPDQLQALIVQNAVSH